MNLIWGPGIPGFMPTDVMTEDEIREYGVRIALAWCHGNEYEVINAQAAENVWPNIVAKKDGKLWFIAVATKVAPEHGKLEQDEKEYLVGHANEFNAKAAVLSVSFGSKDPERFSESIALHDDDFLVSTSPLEVLN